LVKSAYSYHNKNISNKRNSIFLLNEDQICNPFPSAFTITVHFWIPQLQLLVSDFDVGYLYEFVVEFPNILHFNISFSRGSKF